jgi:C1A family cysteine protease
MKSTLLLLGAALCAVVTSTARASNSETTLDVKLLNNQIKASGAAWVAKESRFSHLSKAEAVRMMGLAGPLPGGDIVFSHNSMSMNDTLPPTLDWRNNNGKNWVSPILNQGDCGSCVAFASIGTMETQYKIASGYAPLNIQLSTQNAFACGGAGCQFGSVPNAMATFLQQTGVVDEACAPNTEGATGQDVACSAVCADSAKRTYRIANFTEPTDGTLDIDAVKRALQNGPLVTTLTVYADFMSYSSGVYTHVTGDVMGGHAISIVGYDDTTQSFIVRNSWGQDWGEKGFAHVSYNDISGVGQQTWAYQVPALSGAVSLETPRDYTYTTASLPVKAFSTFTGTDTMTISLIDSAQKSVLSSNCSGSCQTTLDVSGLSDGRYEMYVTALDAHGTVQGLSPHQQVFVVNHAPTLSLSFTGASGTDLTQPLKAVAEFSLSPTSSSVPFSSMEFHFKGPDGTETVRHAPTLIPGTVVGWNTARYANGTYEIWMVGKLESNSLSLSIPSAHVTVTVAN